MPKWKTLTPAQRKAFDLSAQLASHYQYKPGYSFKAVALEDAPDSHDFRSVAIVWDEAVPALGVKIPGWSASLYSAGCWMHTTDEDDDRRVWELVRHWESHEVLEFLCRDNKRLYQAHAPDGWAYVDPEQNLQDFWITLPSTRKRSFGFRRKNPLLARVSITPGKKAVTYLTHPAWDRATAGGRS